MTPARSFLPRWSWLAAVLLMLGELVCFELTAAQREAQYYPRWNDQIQYLGEAYRAYEVARSQGFIAGLKSTCTKPALQGTLHDVGALFIFTLNGHASRRAALGLNLLVFLAWQAALLAVIPRITGSRALGWAAFGLLLCLAWPWSGEAGSAVDFRLDHGAMCLMGLTAAVALLTDGFRHTGWSLVFGAVVGITLLERFLTGAYFAAIFAACGIWVLAGSDRWCRLRNLVAAGLVCTALALPFFWVNRTDIYNYYWVGHVSGAEGAARFRGLNLWRSVEFIFGNFGRMHLGWFFGVVVATVALVLGAARFTAPAKMAEPTSRGWLFMGLVFLLVPAAVLSVHPQKSEFVLGVLAPGAVLLVLWLWHQLVGRLDATGWRRVLPTAVAAATLAAGLGYFVLRQLRDPFPAGFAGSAQQVNVIADHVFDAAHRGKIATPAIGVDQVVDFADAQILGVICYERHHVQFSFVTMLPNSILAEPDDVTFYKLKLCDFVILTDRMPGDGYWPYDKRMRELYPQLKAWCDTNLRLAKTVQAFGREMSLYQRREIP